MHFGKLKLFVLSLLLSSGAAADTAEVVNLQKLGNNKAAFERGTQLLAEHAGDSEFDLAYARAAVALGRLDDAVFTLERVLWNDPNNTTARLLLAQAYLDLKAFELAREQSGLILVEVEAGDLQNQAVTIYRIADSQMIDQEASLKYGQLSLSAGYDSNHNAQTDANSSLTQNSKLKLGVISRISPEFKSRFELSADQETFGRSSSSNNHRLKIKLGGDYEVANSRTRFELSAQRDWRDEKVNQEIYSARLGYRYALSEILNSEIYTRYSAVDHKQSDFDSEGVQLGVLGTLELDGDYKPLLFGGLFWGDSDPESSSTDVAALIDSENVGLQLGARLQMTDRLSYTGMALTQNNRYDAAYDGASTKREDDLKLFINTLRWNIDANNSVDFEWSARDNDSNTAEFSYKRDRYMLTYTYSFGG